jgi:3-deoxy-manno-octulosonate cytidylyltransferase (CMP-KDO synthetase)
VNYPGQNPRNDPPNKQTKAVAIIPARYESVRLPGKALLEIAGKPMICWVVERALAARNVERAIVATDDQRIVDAVELCGYEASMTRPEHKSGTDRIAEVAADLTECEIVVNVQGDEPFISSETIERAVDSMGEGVTGKGEGGKGNGEGASDGPGIVTTWEPMDSTADVLNPDVVKVVVDDEGRAVYFSRSPVPYPRDAVRKFGSLEAALESDPALLAEFRKHTGLYVYRREVLLEFTKWPQTELEKIESLEQLRALEHGVKIKAIKACSSSIGIDTAADLERARQRVSSLEFRVSG